MSGAGFVRAGSLPVSRYVTVWLMASWTDILPGRFLVFDGPDGSGKSTQLRRFLAWVRGQGITVTELREPGGTPIGERIREVLLDVRHEEMTVTCEMLLYMASRAQIVEEVVAPALARGDLVVADRFISSTHAYQGSGGGLSFEAIDLVGDVAVGTCRPDLTIVFDVDPETASRRLNPLLDRMERKGDTFHARVRRGYLEQADRAPENYLVIDARPDEATVFRDLCLSLQSRLKEISRSADPRACPSHRESR